MKRLVAIGAGLCLLLAHHSVSAQQGANSIRVMNAAVDAGLTLPKGFSASIVAEGVQGARHLAVNKQGELFIKLGWLNNGKGIIHLKDANHDGFFDQVDAFGDYPGTGIAIRNQYLYTSSNKAVYRYALNAAGEPLHPDQPETIVSGLVDHDRDNSKSLTLDNKGHLFVVVGSYSNSCLLEPDARKAPNPCPLLDSVGGVWQFDAAKTNQQYANGTRYATGFKNIVGLDWNPQVNAVYIMQHGRDQLHDLFPQYYTEAQQGLLPAETMYRLKKGSNGGWPYVYYDPFLKKQVLAPEYGGDGKKGPVKPYQDPVVAFPAHLAPNGLLFYTGNQFPARYKNGAFIAFHGRSPQLQKAYLVAFVPMKNGQPSGAWEIFAENFMPGKEMHRPCGLAQGPDGSIYVTDDAGGRIYKISYTGK